MKKRVTDVSWDNTIHFSDGNNEESIVHRSLVLEETESCLSCFSKKSVLKYVRPIRHSWRFFNVHCSDWKNRFVKSLLHIYKDGRKYIGWHELRSGYRKLSVNQERIKLNVSLVKIVKRSALCFISKGRIVLKYNSVTVAGPCKA